MTVFSPETFLFFRLSEATHSIHSSNESQGSFSLPGRPDTKKEEKPEPLFLMPFQGCVQPFHIPIQSSRDSGPVPPPASEAAPWNNRGHGQDHSPA